MFFRTYRDEDKAAVIDLWRKCDLVRPWNDPEKDIARKLRTGAELFIVGVLDEEVKASAMAGYDGHRGYVYYLCVDPEIQRNGYGKRLMSEVEALLSERGCPKVDVLIRSSNEGAVKFYDNNGYKSEDVVCCGKRLIVD